MVLGRELRSWGYLKPLHNGELRSYHQVSKQILGKYSDSLVRSNENINENIHENSKNHRCKNTQEALVRDDSSSLIHDVHGFSNGLLVLSLFEITTYAMHLYCFGGLQLRMAGDDAGSSAYPSLVSYGHQCIS